jgi:hypothetical protein
VSLFTSVRQQAANITQKALRLGGDFAHPVSDDSSNGPDYAENNALAANGEISLPNTAEWGPGYPTTTLIDSTTGLLTTKTEGNPPLDEGMSIYDIYADRAERMGDEYTSLYEQDTTGIKGGDFERFGAFADNHLDFIRALTRARGMDPISSDREIGAFLNTFDKLAAMPEPTPAKQEKDELSAGACDPADPLNLEQSSSYGMTR